MTGNRVRFLLLCGILSTALQAGQALEPEWEVPLLPRRTSGKARSQRRSAPPKPTLISSRELPDMAPDLPDLGDSAAALPSRPQKTAAPAPMASSVLVQLDGTGSADPDGDKLAYRWRQIAGPKIKLSDPTGARPFFRTRIPGEYRFALVVSDGTARSDPAEVRVTVERQNALPEAIWPENVTVSTGKPFLLDASQSRDADGDPLQYRFRQMAGPPLFLKDERTLDPRFTLTIQKAGVYEFELRVYDGQDWSAPALCRVEVKRLNRRPTAKAGAAQKVEVILPSAGRRTSKSKDAPVAAARQTRLVGSLGVPISLDGTPSYSPAGLPLRYYWQQRGGPFINSFQRPEGAEGIRAFTPELVGTYVFQLVVSDGKQDSAPLRVEVRVVEGDMPPVAMIQAPEKGEVGHPIMLDGSRSYDRENAKLTYHWRQLSGPTIQKTLIDRNVSSRMAFKPAQPGVYTFRLTVSDGNRESRPAEASVLVSQGNARPQVSTAALIEAVPQKAFILVADGRDPEEQPLTYSWRQVDGPILLKETVRQKQLELTPRQSGLYRFAVTVHDGKLESEPAICLVKVAAKESNGEER